MWFDFKKMILDTLLVCLYIERYREQKGREKRFILLVIQYENTRERERK